MPKTGKKEMNRGWIWLLLVGFIFAACDDSEEVEEPDAGEIEVPDVEPPETPDVDENGEDVDDEGDVDIDPDTGGDTDVDIPDPDGELRSTVEVYTDEQGMPHIYAESFEDLFYVNGYVQARDRLGQMEFYRRVSTGTLSEILGGLSEQPIAVDTMFRMLGLERSAKQYWEENYDPDDEAYIVLESFSAGVNAYLDALQEGEEELSGSLGILFPADSFRDWKPWHTLAIARLLAVELTYYTPLYIELTEIRQRIFDTFPADSEDDAIASRSGMLHDVLRLAPATEATHIDGFPNAFVQPGQGPTIDPELLANARQLHQGLSEVPGVHGSFDPFNIQGPMMRGSNNWVLSGDHSDSGNPQVANDPHLGLSLPSVFYPMHLVLEDDIDGREDLEIIGAAYTGTPGVVIGRNNDMAWGTTVGFYDYVDVYHEQISGSSSDSEPATVRFDGDDIPVERVEEPIHIGVGGNITETIDYTVEIVPHHGPIIPPSEGFRPVERESEEALSVKWVGLEPSNEFEFLLGLWRADSPDDVEEALTHYHVGSSNFVFGFSSGDIYYSGRSDIPVRPDEALTFDAAENPEGVAPIFVLPGDGSAEWQGFLDDDYIPHALNPEKGYIITANNDPVGVTLDNNPFDDEHYIGGFFDIGYRGQTIEERIDQYIAEGQPMSLEDHIAVQDDPHDGFAEAVVPHIVAAIDVVLADEEPDEDSEELVFLRDEIDGEQESLQELRDLLAGWDFAAPADREPIGDDIDRSSAAILFNATAVYLLRNVFGDEMEQMGYYDNGFWSLPRMSQVLTRSLVFLLDEPEESLSYDEDIGDSIYFDDMNNEDVVETRLTMLVRSVLQARERLATAAGWGIRFGRDIEGPESDDPEDWIWGNFHGLSLDGFFPGIEGAYQRPATDRPFFARPGGTFSVSPCGNGYVSFNFTCSSGSSLRMVHDLDPDGPVTYNAIPGGASENPDSPHFDDQIERWNQADPYRLISDRDELEEVANKEIFEDEAVEEAD